VRLKGIIEKLEIYTEYVLEKLMEIDHLECPGVD
jgi:hypothetical protein